MKTALRSRTYYRRQRWMSSTSAYLFMGVFLGYFLLPLLWLVLSSTKTNADLFATFGFWFGSRFNLFQNIRDVFAYDHGSFGRWMLNTAVYASYAALGSSLISALAGYAFAQYRFKGRGVLFGVVLASVFVPPTVFAVPLFLLINKSGLSGSLLAIILPALVNPFGVYLMRIYTERAVNPDIVDAARVDGAGELRIFFTIVFRLLAPAFVTVLLFAFVNAWNNYFLPLLLLSKSNLYILTVGLAYWNSLSILPGVAKIMYALVVTGSLIAIVPVMVLFLFLQSYWQEGLSLGSVTG